MAQAYGASIKTVFDAVKDIVNKEQNGFISVDTFNTFAKVAQVNIFNKLFDEVKDAKRLSRGSIMGGRDKARIKQIEEDLAFFSKSSTLTKNSTTGKFDKPEDMSRIISITTEGSVLMGSSTRKIVDMCYDEEKLDRILLSPLSAPKASSPLAFVSDAIEVYPSTVNKINLRYYKTPQSRNSSTGARTSEPPKYQVITSITGGVEVDPYESTNYHKDFELPERYEGDLILEICKMAGVNLRDSEVINYVSSQQSNNNIEQNG
jgi:hypothetical protein